MRITGRQSSIFFLHNAENSATIGWNSGDKSGNGVLTDELAPIINKLSGWCTFLGTTLATKTR